MARKKILIVSSAVFVVGIITGVAVVPGFIPFTGSTGTYLDYLDEEELVRNSERIVIAQYVNEDFHVVDMKNAHDNAVLGKITLTVQRFQNIESLKGNAAVGDMTYVAIKSSDSYNLPGGEEIFDRETVPLTVGNNYVVFLREVPPRPEYNGQYGDVVWAYVGEPGIAQIQADSDKLQFKVTERFKDDWDVLPNSDAPFELSKQGILDLVSSEAGAR